MAENQFLALLDSNRTQIESGPIDLFLRGIEGAEGYFVSLAGDIYSFRVPSRGKSDYSREPKKLKLHTNGFGYLVARMSVENRRMSEYVHRIVCRTFHGPKAEGQEVRHLDGNRLNNWFDNLCWGTRKENMADKIRHGTSQRGSKAPNSKLNEMQVADIKRRFRAGESQLHLGRVYGVSNGTVSSIVNGQTWRHVVID